MAVPMECMGIGKRLVLPGVSSTMIHSLCDQVKGAPCKHRVSPTKAKLKQIHEDLPRLTKAV